MAQAFEADWLARYGSFDKIGADRHPLWPCLRRARILLAEPVCTGWEFCAKAADQPRFAQKWCTIGAIHKVRKSLSAIKGGELAAAESKVHLITFLISDVPGDDPGATGSDPTLTNINDFRAIIVGYR